MTRPPSPADNVTAVFAVLQQNWPVQFKRDVDQDDPAGVWKSNVGYFKQNQLEDGLRALRKLDDKFMPNGPACAMIIREATKKRQAEAPVEPSLPACERSANILWMSYCMKMVLHRNREITKGMATAALAEAKQITRPYTEAWNTEPRQDDETFGALMDDMGGQLIPAWNRVCHIEHGIETVAQLHAIGNRR